MNDIFTGKLVRLSAFDPRGNEQGAASLGPQFGIFPPAQLLDRTLMQSSKAAATWMEKEVMEFSPASYFFSIRTIAEDRLIGALELDVIDWSGRDAFVGLGIGETEYWGKGYGTDVMRTSCYALPLLEINLASCHPDRFRVQPVCHPLL